MMSWIYWSGWLLFRSIARSVFGLKIEGADHLVREGGVLVVSNHESFIDPPLIGTLYEDEMHFLARKTLFRGPTKWLYRKWNAVPVDQERPDMVSLKTIIRLLRAGNRVLVFPEGARTMDGQLGEAQAGVGLIAVKAGVPIQPIRIRGAREALPRGTGRVRFARLKVHVGPAFSLSAGELDAAKGKEGYKAVADRIMAEIAAL